MGELFPEDQPSGTSIKEHNPEEGVTTIARPNDVLLFESFKLIIRGPSEVRRPIRQAHLRTEEPTD